jgi:hypothetical protein
VSASAPARPETRELPNDKSAEQSVLGAMLSSPGMVEPVLSHLTAEDFYHRGHRTIFEAIREVHRRGVPPDPVTVKDELRRRGELDDARVPLYVHHLAETVAMPASAPHYAGIVAKRARARRLLLAVGEARTRLADGEDPERVAAQLAAVAARDASDRAERRLLSADELARRVDRDEAAWLVEDLWPADAYGVIGAEDKAGKTWALLDLAVSVATGTPWLERFACPTAGPVLLYLGEGGERAMLRRLRAITRSRGVSVDDLRALFPRFRAPRLADPRELDAIAEDLASVGERVRLVGIDPLYLSVPAGSGADLYAMGALLGGVQRVCQDAGAALAITTHWNKTGEGSGPRRFTGAGPGAWGRVLASAAVERPAQEPDGTSDVLLRWAFEGSEIASRAFRVRRRVRAEDPSDLGSPLAYSVSVTDEEAAVPDAGGGRRRSPSERRVLAALEGTGEGDGRTVRELGDRIAADGKGPPLRERTIQEALRGLAGEGEVDGDDPGPGLPVRWWRSAGLPPTATD